MKFPRLFNPLLLRRLIRAQERQADALEEIAKIVSFEFGRTTKVVEQYPEEEDDIIYTTDETTFYRELDDRSRVRHTPED